MQKTVCIVFCLLILTEAGFFSSQIDKLKEKAKAVYKSKRAKGKNPEAEVEVVFQFKLQVPLWTSGGMNKANFPGQMPSIGKKIEPNGKSITNAWIHRPKTWIVKIRLLLKRS